MSDDFSKAIDMIKAREGFRAQSYQDPVGVWTIGFGTTQGVTPGQTISEEDALAMVKNTVTSLAVKIFNMVTVQINNNQLCALIDFAYNLGLGSLHHSKLLTELNSGAPASRVAAQFLPWDHAGGKVLPGLRARRRAEADLFLNPNV